MLNLSALLRDAKYAEPTSSEYLDGRYFNLVLDGYKGLVTDPVIIRVRRSQPYENSEGQIRRATVTEISNAIDVNLGDRYPDLIRLIIETENPSGELVTRHSNLLVLVPNIPDHVATKYKGIGYRFEPLKKPQYYHEVNDFLKVYLDTIGYDLKIIDSHPQGSGDDREMCLAYVLKYAAMYVSGLEEKFYEDKTDIRSFVTVVQDNYDLPKGPPDLEFGTDPVTGVQTKTGTGALVGGLTGALFGPVGLLVGAGLGAAAGSQVKRYPKTVVAQPSSGYDYYYTY